MLLQKLFRIKQRIFKIEKILIIMNYNLNIYYYLNLLL